MKATCGLAVTVTGRDWMRPQVARSHERWASCVRLMDHKEVGREVPTNCHLRGVAKTAVPSVTLAVYQ